MKHNGTTDKVRALLSQHGPLSVAEMAAAIGVHRDNVSAIVSGMRRSGEVSADLDGRTPTYRLAAGYQPRRPSCKPNGSVATQAELDRASAALETIRSTPPAPVAPPSPASPRTPVAVPSPAAHAAVPETSTIPSIAVQMLQLADDITRATMEQADGGLSGESLRLAIGHVAKANRLAGLLARGAA